MLLGIGPTPGLMYISNENQTIDNMRPCRVKCDSEFHTQYR